MADNAAAVPAPSGALCRSSSVTSLPPFSPCGRRRPEGADEGGRDRGPWDSPSSGLRPPSPTRGEGMLGVTCSLDFGWSASRGSSSTSRSSIDGVREAPRPSPAASRSPSPAGRGDVSKPSRLRVARSSLGGSCHWGSSEIGEAAGESSAAVRRFTTARRRRRRTTEGLGGSGTGGSASSTSGASSRASASASRKWNRRLGGSTVGGVATGGGSTVGGAGVGTGRVQDSGAGGLGGSGRFVGGGVGRT